ncbi:MAG TPA: hypothetical protein VN040_04365 [Pseudosphingobacterium sp.]|nr:hypothetical protein [Pseudosphingobacterium sp.]
MMRTPELWTKFYENLAFLFYTLSCCDGDINKGEVASIKTLLEEVWLDLEPSFDKDGSNAAYQIETKLDWLLDVRPTAAFAFKRFSSFIIEHPAFMDQKLAENVFNSARRIVSSHAGRNKQELGYLYKLQETFRKIKPMMADASNSKNMS